MALVIELLYLLLLLVLPHLLLLHRLSMCQRTNSTRSNRNLRTLFRMNLTNLRFEVREQELEREQGTLPVLVEGSPVEATQVVVGILLEAMEVLVEVVVVLCSLEVVVEEYWHQWLQGQTLQTTLIATIHRTVNHTHLFLLNQHNQLNQRNLRSPTVWTAATPTACTTTRPQVTELIEPPQPAPEQEANLPCKALNTSSFLHSEDLSLFLPSSSSLHEIL